MENKILEEVQSRSPEELYRLFIERVVEQEAIWGLYQEKKDGWAVTVDENKTERLVLWSESGFAKMNAVQNWNAYGPEPIDLYGFVESGIEELVSEGRSVSIMYFPEVGGLEVGLEFLKRDLEGCIEQYYPSEEDGGNEEE
ncbi:MAG: DUF2750 domain-containing protein [Bacteroidia bacterium]|nr:DUF2750 domain-containing protein [Bacteroidia bacterium]